MDNTSAFSVNQYDTNIRKVIPLYDMIYEQIISVIQTCRGNRPLLMLDTGCGTGTFARKAYECLSPVEMVLCDPSPVMLTEAKRKLAGQVCEWHSIGSECLPFQSRFDVVTAIQSHHYFDRPTRKQAVTHCFDALKPGGLLICVENTAPYSPLGRKIMLQRLETFERQAGRKDEEIRAHSARYDREFFPITIQEHLDLFRMVGFTTAELFWHSYMQSGFYAIKP